jgi:hypothetical protein|tara:strand:- start:8742 stop:9002 length:261 start_codon:yes stop_codon:yes gene_type:complete
MINSLNNRWKQFILNEGATPDISVWIQSLKESLGLLKPRTMREGKRIELMSHQLNEIRKASNRLQRENKILQEENQLLQEQSNSKE